MTTMRKAGKLLWKVYSGTPASRSGARVGSLLQSLNDAQVNQSIGRSEETKRCESFSQRTNMNSPIGS